MIRNPDGGDGVSVAVLVNVAVTVTLAVIVSFAGFVLPDSPPDHPLNVYPAAAAAVTVTDPPDA